MIRQIAKPTQPRALAAYRNKVMERLSQGRNDGVWWKMTRSLSGLCKPCHRSTSDVNALGEFLLVTYLLRTIIIRYIAMEDLSY